MEKKEKIIAFVPVRGGSKSIPMKNIKLLCGKPLVFWVLHALHNTELVDEVVVSTDSDTIAKVVEDFCFLKVRISKRSDATATDESSTESAMLEFIQKSELDESSIFILVQATSPLLESTHLTEGIVEFKKNDYDSLLSCVRSHRFFWSSHGTPVNYDYRQRPRRQDMPVFLMENGAYYINTVGNILRDKSRISGRIGIYQMPEYTGLEIDEIDDWPILERLMKKYYSFFKQRFINLGHIKLFATDVDGVLTDAGMYYSESGDELKKFNTHDGKGIEILRELNIKTAIVSSEKSKLIERRARKLKFDFVFLGVSGSSKLEVIQDVCKKESMDISEVAYIGDDINCYELLSSVGVAACPSNALPEIRSMPNILQLNKAGGEGAVREFVELIAAARKSFDKDRNEPNL
jgi:YrbI family 3-deoxy-D-manno-octulosonate 8-phosphate phosphatase